MDATTSTTAQQTTQTTEQTQLRLCKDCKHLLGKRDNTWNSDGWRCGAPQNIIKKVINLVNGEEENVYVEKYCLNQRNVDASARCGKTGEWFSPYEKPAFYSEPQLDPLEKILAAAQEKKSFNPRMKKISADDL